jgi:hypothetical protein
MLLVSENTDEVSENMVTKSAMMMEAAFSSETYIIIYQATWYHAHGIIIFVITAMWT